MLIADSRTHDAKKMKYGNNFWMKVYSLIVRKNNDWAGHIYDGHIRTSTP